MRVRKPCNWPVTRPLPALCAEHQAGGRVANGVGMTRCPAWELHGLLDGKALAPERWGWVRQEVGDGNPLRSVLYLIGNSIFFFFFSF